MRNILLLIRRVNIFEKIGSCGSRRKIVIGERRKQFCHEPSVCIRNLVSSLAGASAGTMSSGSKVGLGSMNCMFLKYMD
ncbi:hypothetical protein quinque_014561 [Culex quinquefasciatus]